MNFASAITVCAWIFATAASLYAQTNVITPSTFSGGRLTFSRVPNTIEYQVQWSPGEQGPWTTFVHAAESAALIHAPGAGSITTAVPLNFRVIARSTDPNSPEGMVTIPGGDFARGADFELFPEITPYEIPLFSIFISTFYMDRYEVTGAMWGSVVSWGFARGYLFGSAASKGPQHPVHSATWYDALKFCNARSERDGLTPCYISSGGVYRAGIDTNVTCNFAANGYRLPTSAEWEKAAKGGTSQLRFPWTDFTNRISHAKANYRGELVQPYDLSNGFHPAFTNGAQPWTSPVGSFAPNAFGLYDMAGNVREWCWDWHELEPYSFLPSVDPTGPAAPSPSTIPIGGPIIKTVRGGSWGNFAEFQRVTYRDGAFPTVGDIYTGIRCVRRP